MLDADIAWTIRQTIEADLASPRVPRSRVPRLKSVWGCDCAHDFLYGQRAGYYTGLAEGMSLARNGRQLTEGENEEVYELIAEYKDRLRGYFSYYRPSPPATTAATRKKKTGKRYTKK